MLRNTGFMPLNLLKSLPSFFFLKGLNKIFLDLLRRKKKRMEEHYFISCIRKADVYKGWMYQVVMRNVVWMMGPVT